MALDTFPGADHDPLNAANWLTLVGSWEIIGNGANPAFAQTSIAKWIAGTYAADHSAIAQINLSHAGGSIYGGLAVRLTGTASNGSDLCGYYVIFRGDNSRIYRLDNGVATEITNGPTAGLGLPFTADDSLHTYAFACVGASLVATEDGVTLATASDATYATGRPGMFGNEQNDDHVQIHDFDATGADVAGQPTMKRWGGVPNMGTQKLPGGTRGGPWGSTDDGLIVPRRLAA